VFTDAAFEIEVDWKYMDKINGAKVDIYNFRTIVSRELLYSR